MVRKQCYFQNFHVSTCDYFRMTFPQICEVLSSMDDLVVKNLPTNAGGAREVGSLPGSGRSTGEGNGNLFQYSCLENPMDGGAWWSTIHGVTKSQARPCD